MAGPDPEEMPELGQYKTTIEVRETEDGEGNKYYKAEWRGISGRGITVSDALRSLASAISE